MRRSATIPVAVAGVLTALTLGPAGPAGAAEPAPAYTARLERDPAPSALAGDLNLAVHVVVSRATDGAPPSEPLDVYAFATTAAGARTIIFPSRPAADPIRANAREVVLLWAKIGLYAAMVVGSIPLVASARQRLRLAAGPGTPAASAPGTAVRLGSVVIAAGAVGTWLCVTLIKYFHELIEASRFR